MTPRHVRGRRWLRSPACAEAARDHAVDLEPVQRLRDGLRLCDSFGVQGTSAGLTGLPSSPKYETSAWRIR